MDAYFHHTRPARGWSWHECYRPLWDAGYDVSNLASVMHRRLPPDERRGETIEYPDIDSQYAIKILHQESYVLPGAIRSNRKSVYFKAIPSDGMESRIMHLLSTPPLSLDPRNHVVPTLDIISCGRTDVLVMPFLDSPFTSGEFATYKQVYYCVEQILEGLDFLHENLIAHMDFSGNNILFNRKTHSADSPSPYYIIDYQTSQICTADIRTHIKEIEMVTDPVAPEAKAFDAVPKQPCFVNAFHLDIWDAGRMLQHATTSHYKLGSVKAERLRELISRMLADELGNRPTAREALNFFRTHKESMAREEEDESPSQ